MKCRETPMRPKWYRHLVGAALVFGCLLVSAAAALGQGLSPSAPAVAGDAKAAPAKTGATTPAPAPVAPATKVEPAQPAAPAESPTAPSAPAPAPAAATADPPPSVEVIQTAMAPDGTLEFHAKNEDLANVLELLSRQFQLNLVTSKNVKGRVTIDLYRVTMDQVLDAICRSNGLKWSREKGAIYVYTAEEGTAMRQDEARLVTEMIPLNFLTAEDAVKLVAPALSTKATVAVTAPSEKGIPTGATGATGANSYGLRDSLVIRDFPENIEAARAILKRLDQRPRQVLVEATILQVKLDDSTSLGVNFNALAGVDFQTLTPTTAVTDPTASLANAGSPRGQVATVGFAAAPGTAGLNIGIMTNNIALFISALEKVTDTTVLSNPKVLALNKQRAEVIVGQRIPYITSTVSETTTIQTVNFLDVGTQLIFRPFISDDGFIRMEIHPKVSSAELIGNPDNPLPKETTTEVTCNIMVKDGYTIVIGGLFDDTTTITRSQVPGLGNIPWLGTLFRSNKDSSVRNEIIVLLTPHIIDDAEEANAIGEQFFDDVKRRTLGLRENFAPFARERIGTGYLQEAEKAWQRFDRTGDRDDLDSALWNVNLASDVEPNNLKAMRLKDQILSEKRGQPYAPTNWSVWDSLHDRLKEADEAKRPAASLTPAEAPTAAPPAATKAEEPKHDK